MFVRARPRFATVAAPGASDILGGELGASGAGAGDAIAIGTSSSTSTTSNPSPIGTSSGSGTSTAIGSTSGTVPKRRVILGARRNISNPSTTVKKTLVCVYVFELKLMCV